MKPIRTDFDILLIEDSLADAKIIERALRESNISHHLTVITNGRDALTYLFALRESAGPSDCQPDLILLDLNLPGLDGCQVLTRIKSDPGLRVIPVVILTTSHRDEDILRTYSAGANSYISKPDEYSSYRRLVEVLRDYWVNTTLKIPHHLRDMRSSEGVGG